MDHYDPWSSNTIGFYNHKASVSKNGQLGLADAVWCVIVTVGVLP